MSDGWIKLHRKMLSNPIVCKDADHVAVWLYLLLNATHKQMPMLFGKTKVQLMPGQLIISAYTIAENLGISESKVRRCINLFKNDAQIDEQATRNGRLITILNWTTYQESDAQHDAQVTHKRRTGDAQVTPNKNDKNDKNDKNKDNIASSDHFEIISYLNERAGTTYRHTSAKTQALIKARQAEKFTVEDFKVVIDNKSAEWLGTEMEKYLRPETLFGTKFEGYLNEKKNNLPIMDKDLRETLEIMERMKNR